MYVLTVTEASKVQALMCCRQAVIIPSCLLPMHTLQTSSMGNSVHTNKTLLYIAPTAVNTAASEGQEGF